MVDKANWSSRTLRPAYDTRKRYGVDVSWSRLKQWLALTPSSGDRWRRDGPTTMVEAKGLNG